MDQPAVGVCSAPPAFRTDGAHGAKDAPDAQEGPRAGAHEGPFACLPGLLKTGLRTQADASAAQNCTQPPEGVAADRFANEGKFRCGHGCRQKQRAGAAGTRR